MYNIQVSDEKNPTFLSIMSSPDYYYSIFKLFPGSLLPFVLVVNSVPHLKEKTSPPALCLASSPDKAR